MAEEFKSDYDYEQEMLPKDSYLVGPLTKAMATFGDDYAYNMADYNKFKAEKLYQMMGGARPTDFNNPLTYAKAKDMPNVPGQLISKWNKVAPFIKPVAKVSPYITAASTLADVYGYMQDRYGEEGPDKFLEGMTKE